MAETLVDGGNVWIAPQDIVTSHPEVTFADDQYDWASLENHLVARITSVNAELPIGPLELQIAYKLCLNTQTDFEDVVHLNTLFEETLTIQTLERLITRLSVEDGYDRLKRA